MLKKPTRSGSCVEVSGRSEVLIDHRFDSGKYRVPSYFRICLPSAQVVIKCAAQLFQISHKCGGN